MADTSWFKQNPGKPLFPDLEWSRPENKQHAGKLLIIGGEEQSFSVPAEAYGQALRAGIGNARVILPEHVKPRVPEAFQAMVMYAPSLKHGSFSKASLAELIEQSKWADTVILAGGFGKNSESIALVERFSHAYEGPLTISGDAVPAYYQDANHILDRPHTLIVATLGELQKLAAAKHILVTHTQTLTQLVESLVNLSRQSQAIFITCQNDIIFVAYQGRIATTPYVDHLWREKVAVAATVWWTQFPDQPFEAATTALIS